MSKSSITARVSDESMATIKAISDRTGAKNQAIYDRVFDWFGKQDPGTQALILGMIPEAYEGQVAELVLKAIRKQRPGLTMRSAAKADVKPKRGGRR